MLNEIHTQTLEVRKNGSGVEAYRQIKNQNLLHFYAPEKDLRQEKTGIHGRLEVYLNDELVGYDNFNFEKSAQRKAFCGDLVKDKGLGGLSAIYDRDDLTRDMTTFTFDAWPIHVQEGITADMVYGDPTQEVEQYVDNLIIKGGGTIVNALPKKGKSFISMAMAVSVDAGNNTLFSTKQGNTLYVNLERNASSMKRRLAGINLALGLDYDRPLRFLNVRGKSLLDIIDSVRWQIKEYDIKLIVVDSISRAGMGSLVEDHSAMRITDELNKLVEETDRSWLGIAHRSWGNQHVFGSVHFLAACDVMVDIDSAHNDFSKELGIKLSVSGQNDLPPSPPKIVALSFDSMGVNRMRRASEDEFPELSEEEDLNVERINKYLSAKGKQKGPDIAKALGLSSDSTRGTLNAHKDDKGKKLFVKLPGNYWASLSKLRR